MPVPGPKPPASHLPEEQQCASAQRPKHSGFQAPSDTGNGANAKKSQSFDVVPAHKLLSSRWNSLMTALEAPEGERPNVHHEHNVGSAWGQNKHIQV